MKYTLVDNNQIKVGPRDYHLAFFTEYLKQVGVDYSLPVSYEDNQPIVVNEQISIIPTEDPVTPYVLPITEQLAGPFWNITPSLITGQYEVADVDLYSAKSAMKSFIADLRYQKEVAGIKVTVQDNEVSINTNRGFDRDIWFQSLSLLPEGATQKFKFPKEDLWLDLTKSDLQTIVTAIVTHVQDCFDWENQQVAITNAADKEGLNTQYEELRPKPELIGQPQVV